MVVWKQVLIGCGSLLFIAFLAFTGIVISIWSSVEEEVQRDLARQEKEEQLEANFPFTVPSDLSITQQAYQKYIKARAEVLDYYKTSGFKQEVHQLRKDIDRTRKDSSNDILFEVASDIADPWLFTENQLIHREALILVLERNGLGIEEYNYHLRSTLYVLKKGEQFNDKRTMDFHTEVMKNLDSLRTIDDDAKENYKWAIRPGYKIPSGIAEKVPNENVPLVLENIDSGHITPSNLAEEIFFCDAILDSLLFVGSPEYIRANASQ